MALCDFKSLKNFDLSEHVSTTENVKERGLYGLPLRHLPPRKRSPDPAAAGFFRCFRGLCTRGCSPAPVTGSPEAFSRGRYSLDLMTVPFWCSACNALTLNGFSVCRNCTSTPVSFSQMDLKSELVAALPKVLPTCGDRTPPRPFMETSKGLHQDYICPGNILLTEGTFPTHWILEQSPTVSMLPAHQQASSGWFSALEAALHVPCAYKILLQPAFSCHLVGDSHVTARGLRNRIFSTIRPNLNA